VDPHHRVAVADLILVQDCVRQTVERLVRELAPDVVGLSVMTFQRRTATKLIDLVRQLRPAVQVVVGGYDPSLAPEVYTDHHAGVVDFIVRGEGDITFRELVRALEQARGYDHIAGLSYRRGNRFVHNAARPESGLDGSDIRPPHRAAGCSRGSVLGRR
jgi:radical SAM superfamily enzyme YgiQ (UPF0313 family)